MNLILLFFRQIIALLLEETLNSKDYKKAQTHSIIKKGALAISQAQESEKIKWSLMP
jgi:hypothetical protein